METLQQQLARKLLTINAIKLQPTNPFLWASGLKSPIYCDNRKTLSYPNIRNFIKLELSRMILEQFENAEAIVGVATGAIAQGVMIANELNLPFAYIRSKPKDYGLKNLIEGDLKLHTKVVIVEDLISTGGSALQAVKAVRNSGCYVEGMVAIFSYGFSVAEEQFKAAGVKSISLCNYDTILEEALKIRYITDFELKVLQKWRKNPSQWEYFSNTLTHD